MKIHWNRQKIKRISFIGFIVLLIFFLFHIISVKQSLPNEKKEIKEEVKLPTTFNSKVNTIEFNLNKNQKSKRIFVLLLRRIQLSDRIHWQRHRIDSARKISGTKLPDLQLCILRL